jgi:hypothetical protein
MGIVYPSGSEVQQAVDRQPRMGHVNFPAASRLGTAVGKRPLLDWLPYGELMVSEHRSHAAGTFVPT